MSRIKWMDLSRTLAILFVIILHVMDEYLAKIDLDNFQWILYQSERTIGRLSVPVFLMLSGALILPIKNNTLSFYKRRIPQFLTVTIIYSIATNLVYEITLNSSQTSIENLNIFRLAFSTHAYQMWFMYVIILIYLIAPYLQKSMKRFSEQEITLSLIVIIFMLFTPTTLKAIYPNELKEVHIPPLHYIIYFIAGHLIYKKGFLNKFTTKHLALFFTSTFIITLMSQYYLKKTGHFEFEGVTWYTSFFILVLSVNLFLMLHKLTKVRDIHNLLTLNSRYSFGIYLFHLIPMFITLHVLSYVNIAMYYKIPICIVITYLSSFCFVAALSRIRLFRMLVI